MECLSARFADGDQGDVELGLPSGYPVPLKMGVDADREGREYVLLQLKGLEEIVTGHRTYHAVVAVEMYLSPADRTVDEMRVLHAWLEERLSEVDREGLNDVESSAAIRRFLVIGPVRVDPAKEVAAQEGVFAVSWDVTVPVQF